MLRRLGTRRHRLAHRFALVLALLGCPALGRAAPPIPPPPTYQGTSTSPGLCSPRGVCPLPSGDVLVGSDCFSTAHMERFSSAGSFLGSWAFPAGFQGPPNGVTLDVVGSVLVAGYDDNRIFKFSSTGLLLTSWATNGPADIAVNSSGDVFVANLNLGHVSKFSGGGALLGTIGSPGSLPGQIQAPVGLAVDGSDRIYVVDTGRKRIIRYLADGTFDMEFALPGPPVPAGSLTDAAVGPDGNVYVIRFEGGVYQFLPDGTFLQSFGSPLGMDGAFRIFITDAGAMFVSEQTNNRFSRFQVPFGATAATRTTFTHLKAMYR